MQQKPDILLCELCQYLKSKTGVKVSISTMYRTLKKLNISRKKKYLCNGCGERRC
ncbi:MAG: winged helix-turn-helix domain-containing protein [Okeania sp. SIO3C4]|nr:winged helix-turn-helix domain-containing protein [Okeania sp. SIO3B3]NER02073.1 winged helix-turn-helix domain-containing protein [Okeania sp. SIO3C4]